MVTIYKDYADEPSDTFLELPEDIAGNLYALEMDTFMEDCHFLAQLVPPRGRMLEMGCGTGRVARHLANRNRSFTGIDISMPMLRLAAAHRHPQCTFLCMDILAPAFSKPFDTILIPYHTLNLFTDRDQILRCLQGCREYLPRDGILIVQIFIPSMELQKNDRTTFQFQIFDQAGGGRIIKEILKKYLPDKQMVQLEERYRVRPMQTGQANTDYHAITNISGFPLETWLVFFAEADFVPQQIYGSYTGSPYDARISSCCILVLKR